MPVRTRKALLKPDLLRQTETLGGMGMALDEIAYALDIQPEVWERYTRYRPEFTAAIERGQGKATARVKQALYKKAADGDVTAQALWMRGHPPRGRTSEAKPQSPLSLKLPRLNASTLLVPEDAPPKIKASPNALFYAHALCAGWSLMQLSTYAEERFGEHISHQTFAVLKKLLPVDARIPPHYLDTVLRGLEVKIDGIAELQNLIAVQRIRVTQALHSDLDVAQVRAELDMLQRFIKDYTTMAANLGLLTFQANGNGHGNVVEAEAVTEEQRVRNLARSMTLEQRAKLLSMINEIRGAPDLSQITSERFLVREQAALQMLEPDSDASAGEGIGITEAATLTLTALHLSVSDEAGTISEAAEGAVPIHALVRDACTVGEAASAEPDLMLLSVRDVVFAGDDVIVRRPTEHVMDAEPQPAIASFSPAPFW